MEMTHEMPEYIVHPLYQVVRIRGTTGTIIHSQVFTNSMEFAFFSSTPNGFFYETVP